MVNLAQLMYTAMLVCSKQALIGKDNVYTTSLCLYRSLVMLAIAGFQSLFFSKENSAKFIESSEQHDSATFGAIQIICASFTHGLFMFGATITILISLAVLPICYCALAIHTASCLCSNVSWAYNWSKNPQATITLEGAIVFTLSMLVKSCAITLFFYTQVPNSSVTSTSPDLIGMTADPLLQLFLKAVTPNIQY